MLHFENDYNEGAHPALLEAIVKTNTENLAGYGMDRYCQSAKEKIKLACACPEAHVEFLSGGTQTNQVVIASLLKSYEGVLAAETGHIALHEAGAIEYTGHKVLELPSHHGKVMASEVEDYLETYYADANHTHMVFPGMLYISQPTEYGTLYSLEELKELRSICQRYDMPLFVDGARLGYALAARENTVTWPDLARLADVFYIGGTKLGALIGEAVVFTKNNVPKNFPTIVKQHGALLAKTRLIGIQFDVFFEDNLYIAIGQKTLDYAEQLKDILTKKGYPFYIKSPTNQQFVIMTNEELAELEDKVQVSFWEKYDDSHSIVRFATSWSTEQDDLDQLDKILNT